MNILHHNMHLNKNRVFKYIYIYIYIYINALVTPQTYATYVIWGTASEGVGY